jgi:putative hydrolase of the HAD superfamily
MLPERRAVVLDMDDTLYPYRRYVISGFAAVAAHLERTARADRRVILRSLVRAGHRGARSRELQTMVAECGVTPALLPALVELMRQHQPVLSLPRAIAAALVTLRRRGWKLGVLTNGPRAIQARKAAALGLARYVDTIVYATEYGSGAGKPDPEPFDAALGRLGVAASAAVFVGDDEVCDVVGAAGAGLRTVRCHLWRRDGFRSSADAVLDRASCLPDLVEHLLLEATSRHAA